MVKNLNIIKRDGSIVKFNKCKIEDAILKAMKYQGGNNEEEKDKKKTRKIKKKKKKTKKNEREK